MNTEEKLLELFNTSKSGVITTAQVTKAGLYRGILKKLVNNSIVHQVGRGIYVRNDAWEDDFYLLQCKYERGIYSHDTALYLLGYSDRTPAKYTMSFPKGYNAPSLKNENVIIKRVILENYNFGKVEIESPAGNLIYIYDLERSLCDMLRGNNGDIEIINNAMKRYIASKNRNINKLLQYADQLHVKTKILRYLEVLL